MKGKIISKILYLVVLLVMAPMALAGSWSAYVLDESDSPLNGANVSAYDAGTDAFVSSTLTDASGFFNVTGITNSVYLVSSLIVYDADTSQDLPPAGTNDYTLPFNITLSVSNAPGAIAGTVSDASGPLNNAVVRALQGGIEIGNATTTAGAYTISSLADGTYDVEASLTGYLTQTITNIVVQPGSTTNGVDFTLDAPPVCTDVDADGYGDSSGNYGLANSCTYDAADCNDNNAGINPGASEACDGIDNDCDGSVDEGCSTSNGDDDDDDSSTSRRSSGSRLSFYQIPIEFTAKFDENGVIIRDLHRINILKFDIAGEEHQLEVLSVYVDKTKFTISSAPITFELFEKQTKEFDLNEDGLKDIAVTFIERTYSKISIMIKLLDGASQITNKPSTTSTTSQQQTNTQQPTISEPRVTTSKDTEEITGSFWLADTFRAAKGGLFVTIGIILGGLVVYFVVVRPRMFSVS